MSFSASRGAAVWDTSPEEAALVEEVSAPARGIASLAWLRPFTSLLQLDLRHNRLCCLDGICSMLKARPTLCSARTAPGRLRPAPGDAPARTKLR